MWYAGADLKETYPNMDKGMASVTRDYHCVSKSLGARDRAYHGPLRSRRVYTAAAPQTAFT
jgi:hypothetical protein